MSQPERIGPYELVGELARGGMGVVYRARHTGLNREVALKRMLSGVQSNPETLRRFEQEAQAVAQLEHHNIVRVHEYGYTPAGEPFFVMDLVPGESLKERIARTGPLSPEEAATLAETLARTLAYAHGVGIVHRDLKPANVLLDEANAPHIVDFGLAKNLSEERDRLTRSGVVMGTPAYAPPEQIDGDLARIGPRSDVYGLGATLYTMLSGHPPFEAKTQINLVHAVLVREPKAPSSHGTPVPRDLETICLKCLRKDPDERYGSAEALADDLARFLRDEPIEASRPSGIQVAARLLRDRRVQTVTGMLLLGLVALAVGLVWEPEAPAEKPQRAAKTAAETKTDLVAPTRTTQRGQPVFVREVEPITCGVLLDGGKKLLLALPRARVELWNLERGERLKVRLPDDLPKPEVHPYVVGAAPDGTFGLLAAAGRVGIVDTQGRIERVKQVKILHISAVAASSDRRFLAVGGRDERIWVDDRVRAKAWLIHRKGDSGILGLRFLRGHRLVSVGHRTPSNHTAVWTLPSGKAQDVPCFQVGTSAAATPRGDLLVVGESKGQLNVFDLKRNARLPNIRHESGTLSAHLTRPVVGLAFADRGRILYSVTAWGIEGAHGTDEICVWDVATWTNTQRIATSMPIDSVSVGGNRVAFFGRSRVEVWTVGDTIRWPKTR